MKKISLLISLLLTIVTLFSCNNDKYQFLKFIFDGYLNTECSITIEYNKKETSKSKVTKDIYSDIENILKQAELTFSMFNDSTVNTINQNSNKLDSLGNPIYTKVSKEFIDILNISINLSIIHEGFDITIGSLTKLWDISNQAQYCYINNTCKIPSKNEISEALSKVDYNNILINQETNSVYLSNEAQLDFGAIAKGYITNQIKEYFKTKNYNFYVINLGGNIYINGSSKIYENKNEELLISVENPLNINPNLIDIKLYNESISTTSSTYRYIEVDEIKYSHIINSKTGYPVDNELLQVSIIGEDATLVDALSTICFIKGLNEGTNYLLENNLKGIFVTKDKKIYVVGDINYQQTNSEFQIFERK